MMDTLKILLKERKLELNVDKTKFMVFNKKGKENSVEMERTKVKRSKSF